MFFRRVFSILTLIKDYQIKKKDYFYCKNFYGYSQILWILEQAGLIRGYTFLGLKLKIYLKYYKNVYLLYNIYKYIKLNLVQSVSKKKSYILFKKEPHSIFVLNTSVGLALGAKNKKYSGGLLCKLN